MPIDNTFSFDKDTTQKQLRDMIIGDPKAKEYDLAIYNVLYTTYSSKWLQRFRFAELNSDQNKNLFSILFEEGKVACIKVTPTQYIAFKDPVNEYDYLVFSKFTTSYENKPTDLNGGILYIRLERGNVISSKTHIFDYPYKVGIDAAIMYLVQGDVLTIKGIIQSYCVKMAIIIKQIESYSKTAVINVAFTQATIRNQQLREDIIESIRRNEPIIFSQAEGIQNNGEMIAKLRTEYSCLKNELNIFLGWNAMAQQEKKEHFIQAELDSSAEEAEIYAKRYTDSLNCFAQHIQDVFDLKLTLIDTVKEVRSEMSLENIKKQMALSLSGQAKFNKNAKGSPFESVSASAGYGASAGENGFRMKGFGAPNSGSGSTGSQGGRGLEEDDLSGGSQGSSVQPYRPELTPALEGQVQPPVNSYESSEAQTANNFFEFAKNKKKERDDYLKDVTRGISEILKGLGGAAAVNEMFRRPGFMTAVNAENPSIARQSARQFEFENYRRIAVDNVLRQAGVIDNGRYEIYNQQHEFFNAGMQRYQDYVRRFFQRQAIGYQRFFPDLRVEQIEQIFLDSENMVLQVQRMFSEMIEREPVNRDLATQIVEQLQINSEIKTFKDLERTFTNAISLYAKENVMEHVASGTIEAVQKKYTKLYKKAIDQFFIDQSYKYNLMPEEVKYFTIEALNLRYQIDNTANLILEKQFKNFNLLEEKTNSFSLEAFKKLQISPLVASIFLAGRSPLARRLLANMRLELRNSAMGTENFNFMLNGIQQGLRRGLFSRILNGLGGVWYATGLLGIVAIALAPTGIYENKKDEEEKALDPFFKDLDEKLVKVGPTRELNIETANAFSKMKEDKSDLIHDVAARKGYITWLSQESSLLFMEHADPLLKHITSERSFYMNWFYYIAYPLYSKFGSFIYPDVNELRIWLSMFNDYMNNPKGSYRYRFRDKFGPDNELSYYTENNLRVTKKKVEQILNDKHKKVAADLSNPESEFRTKSENVPYDVADELSFLEPGWSRFSKGNIVSEGVGLVYDKLNWEPFKKWYAGRPSLSEYLNTVNREIMFRKKTLDKLYEWNSRFGDD